MFTLQTSFKPLLLEGGGGRRVKFVVEVTVNSKEETLKTFVPITYKNSASVALKVSRTPTVIINMRRYPPFILLASSTVPLTRNDSGIYFSPQTSNSRQTLKFTNWIYSQFLDVLLFCFCICAAIKMC
jgi:hypothetical protein